MLRTQYFQAVVTLEKLGGIQTFERYNKPPIKKSLVTFKTLDDQLFFAEIRKQELLNKDLEIGETYLIHFHFEGCIKGDKNYNNIVVDLIKGY